MRLLNVGYALLNRKGPVSPPVITMSQRCASSVPPNGTCELFWTGIKIRLAEARVEAIEKLRNNPWVERVLSARCEPLKLIPPATDCHERAVRTCLEGTPGIYLWQGPPGTGKTKAITDLVEKIEVGTKILISAHSNRATENVV